MRQFDYLSGKVSDAVAEVCPIKGMSFPVREDKSTWEIDFAPEATDDQKRAARAVIDNVNIEYAKRGDMEDRILELLQGKKLAQAIFKLAKQNNPNLTPQDFLNWLEK